MLFMMMPYQSYLNYEILTCIIYQGYNGNGELMHMDHHSHQIMFSI